ncbi:quinon protein alcohol dehydrogenase-like superfamily [Baffinella frigidus]|nr:quinon protein alcohol dehydrogenase-like superfamily [Cryptophyta sp. CCMP2293]
MGGKRRAQPSGKEEGTAAVSGGAAQGEGPPPRKRQTLGLRLDSDAGSADFRSCRKEGWGLVLAPMTMGLSMRCDPGELVGRKAALEAAVEAAVRIVVTEFGCQDVRVEWTRVGPSEDTLQRVLPLVMERVEPEGGALCFLVCKSWRRELESRGFCNRTVQLCSALAETGDADRLWHQAQRRLHRSMLPPDQDFCMEACAFLKKHSGGGKWSLREWLQATSQEPDASILSRGGLSTSLVLGLPLVGWVGKPQESYTGVYTLKGHSAYFVSSAAFSPDGKRVVTGAYDKLVKIWDVATGQEGARTRSSYPYPNSSVKLVTIWDVETGAEVMSLGEHNGRGICTCAGAINHEGAYDRTNPACPINGHLDIVSVVAFSPDGKRVVSGSGDHLVKIWNAETGAESNDTFVKICNAETGAEVFTLTGHAGTVHTLRGHTGWATCVAFSPDGKRVVSGSYDQLVKIWDAATGQLVRTLTGHSASVVSLTFSPDGKRVVSGSWDKTVKIWDADTGAQVLTLTGDAGMVNSVACSPDGKFIVSGSDGKLVKIWDAATGAEGARTRSSYPYPKSDGMLVKIWDAATGAELLKI